MPPSLKDPVGMGQAWKMDVTKTYKVVPSGICRWVLQVPWAHPVFHEYVIDCVHLRNENNLPKPKVLLTGATHEIVVHALDPDWILTYERYPAILMPTNFSSQFHCENDAAAEARILDTVKEVISGVLSSDTDYIQEWVKRYGDCMIKKNLPKPEVIQQGTTTVVLGMGASNIRKLIGPDNRN